MLLENYNPLLPGQRYTARLTIAFDTCLRAAAGMALTNRTNLCPLGSCLHLRARAAQVKPIGFTSPACKPSVLDRTAGYGNCSLCVRWWPGRAKAGFKLAAVNRSPKAIQRGKSWPDLQRPVMAGCVGSRTAASEQRNSWNPWVPDRQLCGSRNDRSGSSTFVRKN